MKGEKAMRYELKVNRLNFLRWYAFQRGYRADVGNVMLLPSKKERMLWKSIFIETGFQVYVIIDILIDKHR